MIRNLPPAGFHLVEAHEHAPVNRPTVEPQRPEQLLLAQANSVTDAPANVAPEWASPTTGPQRTPPSIDRFLALAGRDAEVATLLEEARDLGVRFVFDREMRGNAAEARTIENDAREVQGIEVAFHPDRTDILDAGAFRNELFHARILSGVLAGLRDENETVTRSAFNAAKRPLFSVGHELASSIAAATPTGKTPTFEGFIENYPWRTDTPAVEFWFLYSRGGFMSVFGNNEGLGLEHFLDNHFPGPIDEADRTAFRAFERHLWDIDLQYAVQLEGYRAQGLELTEDRMKTITRRLQERNARPTDSYFDQPRE